MGAGINFLPYPDNLDNSTVCGTVCRLGHYRQRYGCWNHLCGSSTSWFCDEPRAGPCTDISRNSSCSRSGCQPHRPQNAVLWLRLLPQLCRRDDFGRTGTDLGQLVWQQSGLQRVLAGTCFTFGLRISCKAHQCPWNVLPSKVVTYSCCNSSSITIRPCWCSPSALIWCMTNGCQAVQH